MTIEWEKLEDNSDKIISTTWNNNIHNLQNEIADKAKYIWEQSIEIKKLSDLELKVKIWGYNNLSSEEKADLLKYRSLFWVNNK